MTLLRSVMITDNAIANSQFEMMSNSIKTIVDNLSIETLY